MSHLTLALLQLLPGETQTESLRIGLEACRRAKSLGADLALFPEMWSCGYRLTDDPEKNAAMAMPADSPFVRAFGALAKELDMAIGVTFLEQNPRPDRKDGRRGHYHQDSQPGRLL